MSFRAQREILITTLAKSPLCKAKETSSPETRTLNRNALGISHPLQGFEMTYTEIFRPRCNFEHRDAISSILTRRLGSFGFAQDRRHSVPRNANRGNLLPVRPHPCVWSSNLLNAQGPTCVSARHLPILTTRADPCVGPLSRHS